MGATMFFDEQHMGSDATRAQAERLAALLTGRGWCVAVGLGPAWTFETADERDQFERDWDDALSRLAA